MFGLKDETMDARAQIESFVRNVRARNRRETIACLILLPICACLTVVLPVLVLRYAFALLFLGTVAVLAMIRWPCSLRGDLTRYPADNIEHWRDEMLRQAKLLRQVPVWYLLPFVPGSALVLWFDLMVPGKSWLRLILVIVFVFGFVTWLNFRAAKKLEEEARLLSNEPSNKASENQTDQQPEKVKEQS